MGRRKRWLAVALSVLSATATQAQMPAVVVSEPVFRPATPAVVVPPTPVTTVTTLDASNIIGTTTRPPMLAGAYAPAENILLRPQPQPVNYLLNPYFGYYQTQWRPFPGNGSGPGCDVPPLPVRETFIPIGPPVGPAAAPTPTQVTPPPPPPTPKVIPPTPKPMLIEPPKDVPKDAPKLDVNVPPKLMDDLPLTPPTPPPSTPKPLLLDNPPTPPTRTVPAGGPRLPAEGVTPPDLRGKLPPLLPPETPVGFAETRRPEPTAVTPPKKLASLGVPQSKPDADTLPIIRSAIKDDTQRPDWPIIRTGGTGK